MRALHGGTQTRVHQRIVFRGKEIDPALGFAADLCDIQTGLADRLRDRRIVHLLDRNQNSLNAAILEGGKPLLLRDVGEIRHQLDVFP